MGLENPNPFTSRFSRSEHVSYWGERIFLVLAAIGGFGVIFLVFALVGVLVRGSYPTIQLFGWSFLWVNAWEPVQGVFGIVPFAVGTLLTSAVALLIAVPLALGAAVFLTEQAPGWLRGPLGQLVDLLAAIPSIIYGFWALVVLVPIMRYQIEPFFKQYFGWTGLFNGSPTGIDVFTASVILAIMIIPTIAAVSRETLLAVPRSQREAALSLGATSWETTRSAVIPYARSGIFGGIILGLSRALGETMAVTLTIGNANQVPTSFLSQGQTIASLIANTFTEASGPTELSALIEAGLILLVITLAVDVVARMMLWRVLKVRGIAAE